MTLQTELEQILTECSSGNVNSQPYRVETALQAILATLQTAVLAAAPEKHDLDNEMLSSPTNLATARGFNGGVTEYTKALQQLFESEG